MLMHQGIGLDAFNELPTRKAVHALYECCNSVTMASDLAGGRPYPSHDALFRRADSLLFSLPEQAIDDILESYPKVGSRPGSARSHAEQCALWDEHPGVMKLLYSSARGYAEKFGFDFVMHLGDRSTASAVITAIADRMHNDNETERKVVRNEIARLNRSRLERMLGPEDGYDNWV
ncbi:MAG: 2-oxo-4-hydroxy-4-carboxy-5-ureidoimidazoline decarboxylase [Mycobacterium sp.]|nr:2-oxo-4-hydroxy-4-carboxy-5-ureidoimidazoline decarboxylase [Mycobacterium sp.]